MFIANCISEQVECTKAHTRIEGLNVCFVGFFLIVTSSSIALQVVSHSLAPYFKKLNSL
jgi:hypothetical protein